MTEKRWKRRPQGSNWGDFGPDDQLGRLNLLTAQQVLKGHEEVRVGETFCLSLPLDYPGGNALHANRYPPVIRPTLRKGHVNFNCVLDDFDPGRTDVLSDDLVVLHLQYSTQWDGLSHVGSRFDADADGLPESVYYNGFRAGRDIVGPSSPRDAGVFVDPGSVSTSSAKVLGIENMAQKCVQGRAAMVDLHHHLGFGRTVVGYDAFMRILDADSIEIEEGDMLCLHTGFSESILKMNRDPDPGKMHTTGAALDGRDERLLQWITASGVVAIAADNYAVEAYPANGSDPCCAALPLHEHCLFKLGIHLGELWRLTPLAQWLRSHKRYRFLLTAPPLNLPGAVASPVTPVATV